MRSWTVADAEGFAAECDRLLAQVEPSATLLQLSLSGIVSLSDRIAILARLDNDLRHRLRHLVVTADDLVGRPSEQDLADLRVEEHSTAAGKLMSMIEPVAATAPLPGARLSACWWNISVGRTRHEPSNRVALSNFRKYRDPFVLDGLTKRLNVIIEPNETGKSTLLEAMRAAFIRHRTANRLARSYARCGEAVAPQIEIGFEAKGEAGSQQALPEKCFG
jgi:hypothetical protein